MIRTDSIIVGLYARVSSEQQATTNTIASQIEALQQRIKADGSACDGEMCFIDDGYSGSTLVRPALERLRDVAAAGGLDRLYVYSPDRLARKYAYQVLLVDELRRCGVELIFLNRPIGTSPKEDLLLQVQGMVAEYERAQILERSRRGKLHAARRGSVNVLGGAPYGYRYIRRHEGSGEAQYHVVLEEAGVVQQVFEWVGRDRVSIGEVCRRLNRRALPTPSSRPFWSRSTLWGILRNPAYKGTAAFGKTRVGAWIPRPRPQRGAAEQPRRPYSTHEVSKDQWIYIPVPAIVSEDLFAAVEEQLKENRRHCRVRARGVKYLLQGLVVCKRCGYGYFGQGVSQPASRGSRKYAYYRCSGTDGFRFGGQRVCSNRLIRTDLLDQAVWDDVCSLLSDPRRIEQEYERRLSVRKTRTGSDEAQRLDSLIKKTRRGIARLIDAYENGLLDKAEFEPRIRQAKDRLGRQQAEATAQADDEMKQNELRLAIDCMQEFAGKVREGLHDVDWSARRAIVRGLVKQIEVDDEEVHIIYRVGPSPFDHAPERGFLQHCLGPTWLAAILGIRLVRPVHVGGSAWGGAVSPRTSFSRIFLPFADSNGTNSIVSGG